MRPRRLPVDLQRLPSPGKRLTARDVAVVELAAQGLTDAEIGERVFVSRATVKTRMARIRIKLRARNRAHIVHRAWQEGYLSPEGDSQ